MRLFSFNKYVKLVRKKGITYSEEFKRIFISENEKGKLPRQIFEECGFDVEILGARRIKSSADRLVLPTGKMEYTDFTIHEMGTFFRGKT
jgi:transposase